MVEEETESRPGDGLVDVGIVEDNVGRLSSELESDGFQVGSGGSLHDLSSDSGRSREGDLRAI